MGRFRTALTLPPLPQVLPNFRGWPNDRYRTETLLTELRRAAERTRGDQPVPFYPMRDAAAFFGVPLSLVARIYRELESEGYLVRLRSSGTLLQPKRLQSRQTVRGVVGVPVWQFGYCLMTDWRIFMTHLEEELRAHHFVADFVFYRHDERPGAELTNRLLAHNLDCLVWFKPPQDARPAVQTLAENGIRVVTITDGRLVFAGARYLVSWQKALRQGLRRWRACGVHDANIGRALKQVPYELTDPSDLVRRAGLRIAPFPANLAAPFAGGLLIWDNLWSAIVGDASPREIAAILRRHPVLATHHLDLDPELLKGARADFAIVDWKKVAAQVAGDIASGRIIAQREPVTFEARYHPQADATKFARQF